MLSDIALEGQGDKTAPSSELLLEARIVAPLPSAVIGLAACDPVPTNET